MIKKHEQSKCSVYGSTNIEYEEFKNDDNDSCYPA